MLEIQSPIRLDLEHMRQIRILEELFQIAVNWTPVVSKIGRICKHLFFYIYGCATLYRSFKTPDFQTEKSVRESKLLLHMPILTTIS
jgi:hypothetical protein